jgi:hypothetical protein
MLQIGMTMNKKKKIVLKGKNAAKEKKEKSSNRAG